MTTITALNVRLGMDVSNFSEGANLAKGEVTRVAAIMRQSVPPAEKYKQELDLLNRAFSEAGKQSAQYANAIDMLAKKHQQGKYSAEESAKAQAEASRVDAIAAAAKRRLKFEIDELAKGEKQYLQVLERGKQVTQSVEKAQESHNRRVREYRELLKVGAIDQETYNRAVQRSTKTLTESQSATSGLITSIKNMALAYVGFQTVSKSLGLASQIEDATIAFEVLTGSAAEGKLLFEQIRQFDKMTPITFTNAVSATKTMMSFGVAAQDVQKNLMMLSDVTGGNNDRFRMLALAFSQTSAAGRLMGQDLLQMINAGFNPLQQISKTTGETMIELKKRMEDGGISADEVRRAFESATADGGMFDGMTERLSKTISGKLNIAMSDLEQKLAAAGTAMAPLIGQLLDVFTRLKPWLDATVKLIERISIGLGFAVAAATDLINSLSTFSVDTTEMNKFLDMLDEADRKRARAADEQLATEFAKKNDALQAQKRAEHEAKQEKLKALKEEQDAAKKAFEEQQKRLQAEQKERLKAIEEQRKAQERMQKQAEENFQRELENARKAAMDFFAEQTKKRNQMQDDVARGPGAGIEVGSAEAAKFTADTVNRSIAASAVSEEPVLLQRDVAKKTAELLLLQREQKAQQEEQIRLAKLQLDAINDNKFTRLR